MKNKFSKYLIILLVALNVTCIYFLMRPHRKPHLPPKITDVIKCKEPQKSKIDKLEQVHFNQITAYSRKIKDLRRSIYVTKRHNLNEKSIDSVFFELTKNQYEIEKLRYKYFISIKNLCNKEQQKELDLFIKRMLEHESMRRPKGK
jgi:hypothetical protein